MCSHLLARWLNRVASDSFRLRSKIGLGTVDLTLCEIADLRGGHGATPADPDVSEHDRTKFEKIGRAHTKTGMRLALDPTMLAARPGMGSDRTGLAFETANGSRMVDPTLVLP